MKTHCCHIFPLRRRRLACQRREGDSGAVSAPEAFHCHITIKSEHTPSVRNADKLQHSVVCAERKSVRKAFEGSEKFSVKFLRMHTAGNFRQVFDAVSVFIKSTLFSYQNVKKCTFVEYKKMTKIFRIEKQLRICLHIKKNKNYKSTCDILMIKY